MAMALVTWMALATTLVMNAASAKTSVHGQPQDRTHMLAATTSRGTAHELDLNEIGERKGASQAAGPWTRHATTHLGTAAASDFEDTTDLVAMMHTAPWRNNQPGRKQAGQGRPPPLDTPGLMLTESSRSLGSREGEHAGSAAAADQDREPRERSRHGRRGDRDQAPGHETPQPEDMETRANRAQLRSLDPLCLHDLPEGLTSAEFRPLWLAMLELINEEQAQELRDSVAAGQDDLAMARLLAPRLEQRVRTFAAQLSHREVAYAVIGLQLALMQAADTLTLILEERLQYDDVWRGAEEGTREEEGRPHEESEEEIAVEETEEAEEHDVNALMQRPEKPGAATDFLWKPVGDEDKRRLQECLLDLLPDQTNPEPSLTLLAMIGATPRGCKNDTGEVDTTQVRAPLIRWLRATPQCCLPRAIKTMLV